MSEHYTAEQLAAIEVQAIQRRQCGFPGIDDAQAAVLLRQTIEQQAALTTEREKLAGLVEACEHLLATGQGDDDLPTDSDTWLVMSEEFTAAIAAAKGGV